MSKVYVIAMSDNGNIIKDKQIYVFKDVNEVGDILANVENPINVILRNEIDKECDSNYPEGIRVGGFVYPASEIFKTMNNGDDYTERVDFEISNIVTDIMYHITYNIEKVESGIHKYEYWNICHELSTVEYLESFGVNVYNR